MSEIKSCSCGAKLRLPSVTEKTTFRCPKCKSTIVVEPVFTSSVTPGHAPDAAPVASASATGQTCPICQSLINDAEPAVQCPSCSQAHHQECWTEVGGCSTYGCQRAPAAAKEPAHQQPLTAWGDTKKCPICGETIKAIALKCRYCQSSFDSVDPLTLGDLKRQSRKSESLKSKQNTVIALFVITLIGCPAPIMCIINPVWVYSNQKDLKAAGPVYLILGYSATALSVLYSILIVLFLVFQ